MVIAFSAGVESEREVSDLPFRDLQTSASELEPMVRLGMTSATAWFVAVSGVTIWMWYVPLDEMIELFVIAFLVLVGLVVFFAPFLILHFALTDAKRRALIDIRNEYEEIQRMIEQDHESLEELSLRLEVTDRRLESAKSIQTWPYNVPSAGKFATVSAIPLLTLIQKTLELLNLLGNGG